MEPTSPAETENSRPRICRPEKERDRDRDRDRERDRKREREDGERERDRKRERREENGIDGRHDKVSHVSHVSHQLAGVRTQAQKITSADGCTESPLQCW